jgi:rfaE bifunctional protein nucleotidyltransferase chain/domain
VNGPLVVVGDALLDQDVDGSATRLAPDAPVPVVDVTGDRLRPGGAALAARLAAQGEREVVLVTALGPGPASQAVREQLAGLVTLAEFPLEGDLPVKTRIRAAGHPLVRIDRGGGRPGHPGEEVARVLARADGVLVADYGRGTADAVRPLLAALPGSTPLAWDPHPRGGPPQPGARLVTPNAAEAAALAARLTPDAPSGDSLAAHTARAALLARHWRAVAVAVTLGGRGALLACDGDGPLLVPTPYEAVGDACGAGDCFAAVAALALADRALPEEAVRRAVAAATDFVARGGVNDPGLWQHQVTRPERLPDDPFRLAAAVRARGGTVVAAGGCFDLLHAGHVGLLQAARRLGDCLVVCLNSDASVRRLKGPGRPLNSATDRARVLSGLECVDAVAVFDEDTPDRLLRDLRPHLWVKGGDYAPESLPEARSLRAWGGQALVLPYLDGHSTTSLARRAASAAIAAEGGAER